MPTNCLSVFDHFLGLPFYCDCHGVGLLHSSSSLGSNGKHLIDVLQKLLKNMRNLVLLCKIIRQPLKINQVRIRSETSYMWDSSSNSKVRNLNITEY